MTSSDSNARKVEEYIRNLEWVGDVPDIQKTLVAGNIRAFYFWSQTHLTPRVLDGLYCQHCGELFLQKSPSQRLRRT